MRVLLALALAAAATAGCSKSNDYQRACEHLLVLAEQDLEDSIRSFPADMKDSGERLRAKARASRDSDLATCVAKAEERGLDASCITAADSLDEAMRCLRE